MTLWIVLTVLMAAAAIPVAVPLVRRLDLTGSRNSTNLAIYKDQLDEVEREKNGGLISDAEADMARVEIERRILDAGKSEAAGSSVLGAAWHVRAVVAACGVVVFGSAGLYAAIGSPQMSVSQSKPAVDPVAEAHRRAKPAEASPKDLVDNIAVMVKRLESKLKANPDNADGWRVLGWSYYNMERYSDAAGAYRRATELKKDSAILKSLYGEALVKVAKGKVTEKARSAFEATLAINPDNVRARYFIGLAKEQAGDTKAALDDWIGLLKIAPAGVEWAQDLRKQVVARAAEKGIDIKNALPAVKTAGNTPPTQAAPAAKGPTAEDIKSAEDMSPDDRMAMVRGMVDRLADRLKKSPDDPDGWIQLMRSRLVLQDRAAARTALSNAMTAFSDKPELQNRIRNAASALGLKAN